MQTLPIALVGFGSGILGVGAAGLHRERLLKNNPELARRQEIEERDERNIRLREKSGYASWYVTTVLLAVMSLLFLILGDRMACLIAIAILFINVASLLLFIWYYNKKM